MAEGKAKDSSAARDEVKLGYEGEQRLSAVKSIEPQKTNRIDKYWIPNFDEP